MSQRLFGTSICFSHNESHDLRDSHVCVTQPVLHPHLSSGLKRVPITTKKPKRPSLERYRQRATATGTPPPVADHKATKICNDLEVLSPRIFEGLGLSQIQGNQTTFLLLSSNPLPLPLFFLFFKLPFHGHRESRFRHLTPNLLLLLSDLPIERLLDVFRPLRATLLAESTPRTPFNYSLFSLTITTTTALSTRAPPNRPTCLTVTCRRLLSFATISATRFNSHSTPLLGVSDGYFVVLLAATVWLPRVETRHISPT